MSAHRASGIPNPYPTERKSKKDSDEIR
jgi:hypothetical protein